MRFTEAYSLTIDRAAPYIYQSSEDWYSSSEFQRLSNRQNNPKQCGLLWVVDSYMERLVNMQTNMGYLVIRRLQPDREVCLNFLKAHGCRIVGTLQIAVSLFSSHRNWY
jgi:hypothetical protein